MAWSLHVFGEIPDGETGRRIADHFAAVLEGMSRVTGVTVDSAQFDGRGVGTVDLLEQIELERYGRAS